MLFKDKKVILISGKSHSGKDELGAMLRKRFEEDGKSVLTIHFADPLKMIAEKAYNWIPGDKGPVGRTILQHTGDVYRSSRPSCWANIVREFILGCPEEIVIIPDWRFINEENVFKDGCQLTIRINRPDYDNGLTDSQKEHASETQLDNYHFDMLVVNNGSLEDLEKKSFEVKDYIYQKLYFTTKLI